MHTFSTVVVSSSHESLLVAAPVLELMTRAVLEYKVTITRGTFQANRTGVVSRHNYLSRLTFLNTCIHTVFRVFTKWYYKRLEMILWVNINRL